MTTIDTPPFYAAEMGSSWMTTVGGLEIDTALHVLDVNRQAIPGLYAGGNPARLLLRQHLRAAGAP